MSKVELLAKIELLNKYEAMMEELKSGLKKKKAPVFGSLLTPGQWPVVWPCGQAGGW